MYVNNVHLFVVATQAYWKYVLVEAFLQHQYYVPQCTFNGRLKVKYQVSGAKTHVQYVIVAVGTILLRF